MSVLRSCAALLVALSLPVAPASADPVVSGRVFLPDGAPAEGATVRALPLGVESLLDVVGSGRLGPTPTAEVRADGDGGWRLEIEPGSHRLVIELDGFLSRESLHLLLVGDRVAEDVRLEPAETVRTRILLADGSPAAGARVSATPTSEDAPSRRESAWRTRSELLEADDEGRVTWAVPPKGESTVSVVHPSAAPWAGIVSRSGPIRLAPAETRSVRVIDPGGGTVEGASVWWGTLPVSTSGTGGIVPVPVPADGEAVSYSVVGPEGVQALEPVEVARAPSAETPPLVVELPPTVTIDGRVVDRESGDGLASAVVASPGLAQTTTDRAGGFRLVLPHLDDLGLRAAASGYVVGGATLEVPSDGPPGETTIALQPARWMEVDTVDGSGAPVADVEVVARRERHATGSPDREARGRTDALGRLRLGPLPAESGLVVQARAEGYAPWEDRVVLSRTEIEGPTVIELGKGQRGIGRVVDADGEPLSGAEIELLPRPTGRVHLLRRNVRIPVARAFSGAGGAFAMPSLPSGTFDLSARRTGSAPLVISGVEIPGGEPEEGVFDFGTLTLVREAVVEGRVVDDAGTPLAGVRVTLAESGAESRSDPFPLSVSSGTGADGRFRFRERTPGERVDLSAAAEHRATATRHGVEVPTPEPVTLVLERGASLSGTVIDESGRGIADARVDASATIRDGRSESTTGVGGTTTDANGRWELLELPHAGSFRVQASADGFRSVLRELVVPSGVLKERLTLELRRGVTARGQVVDEDGLALAGVMVRFERYGPGTAMDRTSMAATDASGRFRVDGLPPGRVRVSARAEGYSPAARFVELEPGGPEIELVLPKGTTVSGVVLDAEGSPVAGASVHLRSNTWERETVSGPAGRFELTGVAQGLQQLVALHAERGSAVLELAIGSEDVPDLTVRLDAPGRLAGRILGAEPAELARAEVRAHGRTGMFFGAVDREGNWAIDAMGPGSWHVAAVVADRVLGADLEVTSGEVTVHDFDLDAHGLAVSGVVLFRGEPAPGVQVVAVGSGRQGTTISGVDGRFRIEVGSDLFGLEAVDPMRGLRGKREVRLEDADIEVILELESSSGLQGRVVDAADGSPVAGAEVSVRSTDVIFGSSLAAETGSDGGFRLRGLDPGSLRIRARQRGYLPWEGRTNVEPGTVADIGTLALQRGDPLWLRIHPVPSARVDVHVFDASGAVVASDQTYADAEGLAEVDAIAPGRWRISVSSPGRASVWVEAVVPTTEPIPVHLPEPVQAGPEEAETLVPRG